MFGIHDFGIFLLSSLVLCLTPGPDTLYVFGRSVTNGRQIGVASALGVSSGNLFHTLAAACGLSALLAASSMAFLVIKLLGAAYLVYLGVKLWFSRDEGLSAPKEYASNSFFAAYRQGLMTNLLNPKVALFFLSFMPQFISTNSEVKFVAFLALGLSFIVIGVVWCLLLAFLSSRLSERLRGEPRFSKLLNRVSGLFFVSLGVRLAVTK